MQTNCDIYLLDELNGSSELLQQLRIFAPDIAFDVARSYAGFLGLELKRIRTVAIVVHFRNNGIACVSVPSKYKTGGLTEREARACAEQYIQDKGELVGPVTPPGAGTNPMFWGCRSSQHNLHEGGGNFSIDALDGHIWTIEEMEEYMYDYNNVL